MKSQIQVLLLFLLIAVGYSQPKLSFDLGLGLYQPTLTGYDENETFPIKNTLIGIFCLIGASTMNFFIMLELE